MKKALIALVGMLMLLLAGSAALASDHYTASGIGYDFWNGWWEEEDGTNGGYHDGWIITGYLPGITEAVIPAAIDGDPVWGIASDAFKDCTSLVSVEIVGSKYFGYVNGGAFDNCTSLTSITIPATSKSNGTYRNCTSLEYAHLSPKGGLGDGMFSGCTALKTVDYGGSPDQIGHYAFGGCENLEGFVIPASVKDIGTGAFQNCKKLTELTVPGGVTYLRPYTFENCEALENIILPEGLTTIDEGVFRGCTSLESVYIPESMTRIGVEAFAGCTALETVNVPGTVNYADYFAPRVFSGCTALTDVTLGEGLKKIPEGAFENCTSLRSVRIPEGVRTINTGAFRGCTALDSVSLPASLEWITLEAFRGCTALEWIEVPQTIKSNLGTNAFADCGAIRVVFPQDFYNYNRSDDDPSVNTFAGSDPVIYCHQGSKIEEKARKDGFRVIYLDASNGLYLDPGDSTFGPNVERTASVYAPGMARTSIGWSWQFENGDAPEIFDGEVCYADLVAPWEEGEYDIVAKAWDADGQEYERRQTVVVQGSEKLGLAEVTAPSSVAPGEDFTFTFGAVEHADWYSVWIWPVEEGEPYVMDELIDGPGTYTAPAEYFQEGRLYRLDVQAFGTGYSPSDDSQHPFAVQADPGEVDYRFTLEKNTALVGEAVNFIIDAPGATALRWRDSSRWGSDGDPDHWNDWWAADGCVLDRYFDDPGTYALQIMLSYDENFDWENDDWDAHTWTAPSAPLTVTVTCEGRLSEVDITVPESVRQGDVLSVRFAGLEHAAGYDAVIHDSENWEDRYRAACQPGTVSLLTSELIPGKTYTAEICAFGETGWVSSYTCRDFEVTEPAADAVVLNLENGPYYIGKNFQYSILAPGATRVEILTKVSDQSDFEVRDEADASSMQRELALWAMGSATVRARAYYEDGSSRTASKSVTVTSYGTVDVPRASMNRSIYAGEYLGVTIERISGGESGGLYVNSGENDCFLEYVHEGEWHDMDTTGFEPGTLDVTLMTWPDPGWEGASASYAVRVVDPGTEAVVLPADLRQIGEEAFAGDSSAVIVYVGGNVASIGPRAFADMENLSFVYMDSNVTSIADDAFEGCEFVVFEAPESSYACQWARAHGIGVRAY